jgi:hypothetical protein
MKTKGQEVKFAYTVGKPEVFPVERRAEMAAIQQCRQSFRHSREGEEERIVF